ncbi:MAG: hypothetical protein ACKV22_25745 [Bryobacteraceae bacterium]
MNLAAWLTRVPGVVGLWQRYPFGSVAQRAQYDIWMRPAYGYGLFEAARLAKSLGVPRFSAIEFGVAGGRGLLALENLAREIGAHWDLDIRVIGFDSGQGLPPPVDYRDLPHVWSSGDYRMDAGELRRRLTRAELILGPVAETIGVFLRERCQEPIGFISFDLDYYSSTVDAFEVFLGPPTTRLPRLPCYFDDLIFPEDGFQNDYVGEMLAIREFNERSASMKLCPVRHLRHIRPRPAFWHEQMYVMHDFSHPQYGQNVRPRDESTRQLPLGPRVPTSPSRDS